MSLRFSLFGCCFGFAHAYPAIRGCPDASGVLITMLTFPWINSVRLVLFGAIFPDCALFAEPSASRCAPDHLSVRVSADFESPRFAVWEFVLIAGLIVHGPSISVRFSAKFAERTRFRFGFFPTVFALLAGHHRHFVATEGSGVEIDTSGNPDSYDYPAMIVLLCIQIGVLWGSGSGHLVGPTASRYGIGFGKPITGILLVWILTWWIFLGPCSDATVTGGCFELVAPALAGFHDLVTALGGIHDTGSVWPPIGGVLIRIGRPAGRMDQVALEVCGPIQQAQIGYSDRDEELDFGLDERTI
ncbi:hypothetical protein ACMD2_19516 [Ananas comosus]|uniref:Uncharacterized protein n=1 Tax=Ananas comosus TaxID=4615 RepID=A0A199W4I0_ANACO|nr:hypothetical protein ACMD2_19516 [Ananas comosus]